MQLLILPKHPIFWWNALGHYCVHQVLQSTLFSDTLIQLLIEWPIPLKQFLTYSNSRLRITMGSGVEINVRTYRISYTYLHAFCICRANHHARKNGIILSHQKCSESDIHLLSTDYPNGLSTLLGQVSYCCTSVQYNNFRWNVWHSKICMIPTQNDEICNVFLLNV